MRSSQACSLDSHLALDAQLPCMRERQTRGICVDKTCSQAEAYGFEGEAFEILLLNLFFKYCQISNFRFDSNQTALSAKFRP